MSATHMRFDDTRAREELGYASRPAIDALRDAVAYFVDTGRVDPARAGTIREARGAER